MTPFQGIIAVPATQEAEVCRGCRPFAFVPSVHQNTRSRFAWYGPELPRHVDTRSRAGVPLVGNGIPWVDIAERECSIVIIANSCRRSNQDSLRTASGLERHRTRRDINTRDQSDPDALLRVGAGSNRKQEDRRRHQKQDRSHRGPPRRALVPEAASLLHPCP